MQETKVHTALDLSVIKTLLYYDIFNYPLKCPEVLCYLDTPSSYDEVEETLAALVEDRLVFRFGDFYSIQNSEHNVFRRIKGNLEAERITPRAKEQAKKISKFPFVRAVMASGSLSKNYMDEKSDLDFFIVTAERRLWICRMMLVVYKRLFLKNSHKEFCVNYFIDETHLEIEEKNIFTATELATVLPLEGFALYDRLMNANEKWLSDFFPNYIPRQANIEFIVKKSPVKRIAETALNIFFGNVPEKLFMRMTLRRWEKQYKSKFQKEDFDIAFKTNKHVSKNHPQYFQKQVLRLLNEKIIAFSEKHGL